jgi:hypothetical protein
MTDALSPLEAWNTYYVIVGSAAAALTGLMFVVVTLIPSARVASSGEAVAAFGTPTIVHLSTALFISAALCAPWPSMTAAGLVMAATSAFGLVYVVIVIRRAYQQHDYAPVMEDVIWHMALPLVAYASISGAWIALRRHESIALFWFAGATILLLFIGIHNAWDTVTFIALERMGPAADSRQPPDAAFAPADPRAAAAPSVRLGADDEPLGP